MDRVAYTVLFLYVLILTVLAFPFFYIAWYPMYKFSNYISSDFVTAFSVYLLVILICQFTLLLVPVAIQSQRPIKRRSIVPAVVVGSLLLALLVLGLIVSIADTMSSKIVRKDIGSFAFMIFFVSWLAWGIYFWKFSVTASPDAFINKLTNYLLKGSIVEFLIAVPAHIIARQRTECCAGVGTFMGLTLGISVMLLSFGPGIYYLYKKRIRRLRREEL